MGTVSKCTMTELYVAELHEKRPKEIVSPPPLQLARCYKGNVCQIPGTSKCGRETSLKQKSLAGYANQNLNDIEYRIFRSDTRVTYTVYFDN